MKIIHPHKQVLHWLVKMKKVQTAGLPKSQSLYNKLTLNTIKQIFLNHRNDKFLHEEYHRHPQCAIDIAHLLEITYHISSDVMLFSKMHIHMFERVRMKVCERFESWLVGWLCFTSHRQRGHLETGRHLHSLSLAKDVETLSLTV